MENFQIFNGFLITFFKLLTGQISYCSPHVLFLDILTVCRYRDFTGLGQNMANPLKTKPPMPRRRRKVKMKKGLQENLYTCYMYPFAFVSQLPFLLFLLVLITSPYLYLPRAELKCHKKAQHGSCRNASHFAKTGVYIRISSFWANFLEG